MVVICYSRKRKLILPPLVCMGHRAAQVETTSPDPRAARAETIAKFLPMGETASSFQVTSFKEELLRGQLLRVWRADQSPKPLLPSPQRQGPRVEGAAREEAADPDDPAEQSHLLILNSPGVSTQ